MRQGGGGGGGGGRLANASGPCRPDMTGVEGGELTGWTGGERDNTKGLLSFPTGVEVSQESITIQVPA